MATSAISYAVGAANSKMAQAIREQEERELQMRSRGGRDTSKKRPEEKAKSGGGHKGLPRGNNARYNRWSAPAEFSKPSPMTDRPKNERGASSFHFSVTKISKEGAPTVDGKPLRGFEGGAAKAANHEAYISRDEAPEIVAAVHAAYVERESAAELAPGAFAESDINSVAISEIGEDVPGEVATSHQ